MATEQIDPPGEVVVVDDSSDTLGVIVEMLADEFTTHPFTNGEAALRYLADGHRPDLILLDRVMPSPDGMEVLRRLRQQPGLGTVPVVFVSGLDSGSDEETGLDSGAADYITKPVSRQVLRARVRSHIRSARRVRTTVEQNARLERLAEQQRTELRAMIAAVKRAQDAALGVLTGLIRTRDDDTGLHVCRSQSYVRELALELRKDAALAPLLDDEFIAQLWRGAALHDIGKLAIPDRIVQKPGRLDPAEMEIMKRHTTLGRDVIASAATDVGVDGSFLHHASDMAYCHHERWDGNGYPQGLAGETIPLSARIMAVADVYDALVGERPYKAPTTHEAAVDLIRAGRGTQFDPRVVDAFLAIHPTFADIARHFADDPGSAASGLPGFNRGLQD